MDRGANTTAGLAVVAAIALIAGLLVAAPPVFAIESKEDAPAPDKEQRLEDRLVPIPTWSKDVADNGCPLHAAPSPYAPDAMESLTEIPFWELIQHQVGRYSVRAILDTPETFSKSLEALAPDLRTLTLLHVLRDGLGRDGLHTYFYLKAGQTAPMVRNALEAAGLKPELALFTDAMGLFGSTYPLDNDVRAKAFGYATESQDLNDFDQRLMTLSGKFGNRDAWTGIIIDYVNRTPELWQRIEASRKTLGEMARFEHLAGALASRVDLWKPYTDVQGTLAALTPPQRTLFLLATFNRAFENGGVHQVFYNAEGSIAPDVAEALTGIGLDRQAELIHRGIAMFLTPYPRDTEQRREASFHNHQGWNDWDEQLSGLTDAFYALDGGPQVLHIGGDLQIQGGPGLRYAILTFAKHHDMLPC